jgi:protein-tyrosine phosphatase
VAVTISVFNPLDRIGIVNALIYIYPQSSSSFAQLDLNIQLLPSEVKVCEYHRTKKPIRKLTEEERALDTCCVQGLHGVVPVPSVLNSIHSDRPKEKIAQINPWAIILR